MTPVAQRRLVAAGAIAVALGLLGYVAYGNMGTNLVYYLTPAQLLAKGDAAYGPVVRLGGQVVPGTIAWDAKALRLTFRVSEGADAGFHGPAVLVESSDAPPQMFREKIGVVVEGKFERSQVFQSHRLMVNHSNEYRPPKPGEAPRNYTSTLVNAN